MMIADKLIKVMTKDDRWQYQVGHSQSEKNGSSTGFVLDEYKVVRKK